MYFKDSEEDQKQNVLATSEQEAKQEESKEFSGYLSLTSEYE